VSLVKRKEPCPAPRMKHAPPGSAAGKPHLTPCISRKLCGVEEVVMKRFLHLYGWLILLITLLTFFPGPGLDQALAGEAASPPAPGALSPLPDTAARAAEKYEKKWVKSSLSFRSRHESFHNYDFNDSLNDSINFFAQRWRLKSETTGDLNALMELRYIRASVLPLNSVELAQLYLDIGKKDLVVRPGLQEVLYGDGRIVWNPDWSNEGIFFQGVRSMWKPSPSLQVDGIYLQPLIYHEQPVMGDDLLYGMYSTWKLNKKDDLQFYYLSNLRKGRGIGKRDMELNIPGIRYNFAYGSKFNGTFEGALQTGRHGTSSQNAYAYFLKMRQKIGMPLDPSIGIKYDCASGDTNPRDTVYDGFEVLYNTKHGILGNMDMVGQKNVRDFAANFVFKPARNFEVHLNHHWLTLDSQFDAWYGPRGVALMKDPTGKWGRDMGTEMDYELRFDTNQWNIWAGYGMFTPGECVKLLKKRANAAEKTYFLVQDKFEF